MLAPIASMHCSNRALGTPLVFVITSLLAGCAGAAPATPPESAAVVAHRNAEKNAELLLEQGRAYAELGDSLRAQQYFSLALKSGADEKVAFPLLLRACVVDKNYRLAVEYAEAALSRHPKNARLRFLTGALHGSLGDTARSRERLVRAAKELPQDAEVQFAVGVFFRDDALDLVSADKYFRQYLALEPDGAHVDEAKSSVMERVE
jgi:tetratricopeptide (TPR) repeat protein